MENEENNKYGFWIVIMFILFTLIITLLMNYISLRRQINKADDVSNSSAYKEVKHMNGDTYYKILSDNSWKGEYYQNKYIASNTTDVMKVVSYNEYITYINNLNSEMKKYVETIDLPGDQFCLIDQKYTDKDSNYIIINYANSTYSYDFRLIDCVEKDTAITIYGYHKINHDIENLEGYIIIIPTKKSVDTEIKYNECYTSEELKSPYPSNHIDPRLSVDKPVIYLYPTEETKVSVKLINQDLITHIYPEYIDGWNVIAKPNGDLKDINTGRDLYSLYYESKAISNFEIQEEGFVIKGEDTSKFLEEKLAILGLTEKESEEFIIYWLPILESNKYNYIRFASIDEINENMPLEITPNPDNIIRILMTFKGLDNPIEVKEQELQSLVRDGFTVVEWGGLEIK